jgi:PAS domain S-box-containing protein
MVGLAVNESGACTLTMGDAHMNSCRLPKLIPFVFRILLGWAFLLVGGFPGSDAAVALAQEKQNLLTSAEAVRQLPADKARLNYPVRIQGIVTYYDPDWPLLYVQDRSGGILVELTQQDKTLKFGQSVEVTGISAAGSMLPIVAKADFRLLGTGGLPALRKTSLSTLDIKRDDGQWVQTEGIVHNAYQEGSYSILEIYAGKNKIQIRIRDLYQDSATSLIDARIRVQGVLAVTADAALRPIGFELRVPKEKGITIIEHPPQVPSQLPVTPIATIEKKWKTQPPQHRLRIQGTVAPGNSAGTLVVRDSTGAIEAQILFSRPIAPGDRVDLVGFADLSSERPRIISAIYSRIKASAIESKQETGLPTLTRIQQIRDLSIQDADRGYPVRIRGVLTYHNPQLSMTFIQNTSGAIYLLMQDPVFGLEEGSEYEVEGFSAPGDYAPIIVKPRLRLLGKASLPPAVDLTIDQLSSGQYDCMRVRVQGIVHEVRRVGNRWRLEIYSDGKGIEAWLPNEASAAQINALQDAKILVEGICSIQIGDLGNITGFRLNVASMRNIQMKEPARADPFSAPLRSIRDVLRFANRQEAGHRVRIQGVLLHQQPGKALYIRDETGCLPIAVDHIVPVNASDLLTISGYVLPGDFAPLMDHALIKRLRSSPPPEARPLPEGYAPTRSFHGDLVKVRAKLVDHWNSWDGQRFLLQHLSDAGTTFEALLENIPDQAGTPEIRNGSEMELTGIYQLQSRQGQPYRFMLLLRTPEDMRIIKSAPWWTLKHTYWAIGALFFAIVSAMAWIAMLRKRVRKQTSIIRRQIETEASLEKKYRELFEGSNDIVFACDRAGRIRSINPAGMRALGYDIPDLMQMDPTKLVDPSSLPKIRKWIEQKLKTVETPHLECNLVAKDGHLIPVEINAEILYANGQPAGAQGIARDVTERKQAEETLRRSEEKLRQGQKLESIGKLAGGIAHDFNNILSAILGYAELSLEDVPPNHPVRSNLDQILMAGRRARDVVQQILAFSRKLDQERRPIHLQTTVEEVLKLLRATLPSTIQIRTKLNSKCDPVMADPTQMHQVLLNLATNASHAMREKGGLLEIELEPFELNGNSAGHPPELAPGRYTLLSVRDSGPGIEPEILKRIFEPYFTTKSAGQGSGLGLAVVHGILRSHGGAITVESKPGQGASFHAYLPCCEEKPAVVPERTAEIVKGQGNILLVDDEESIVGLGRRSLEKMGYSVTGETNSVRALELFAQNPDHFDLVLTDQTMPHLTGISLAQEVWKLRPELPIIIASGYSELITSEKAASLGFKALLNKPYTLSELAKAVRQSLRDF